MRDVAARRACRSRRPVLAAASLALLALAACSAGVPSTPAPSGEGGLASLSTQVVHLGVDLPLSGGEAREGLPILNGVRLAVADANAAAGTTGTTVDIDALDDAVNGVNNVDRGAANVQALVDDPAVIGVVGPVSSAVARAEIPIGNAAGLVQCGPANSDPGLTKPWVDEDPTSFRQTHPNDIAYVRVSSTDDQQGAAGARIAHDDLAASRAVVVDDGSGYGHGIADAFEAAFKALGGTVVRREVVGSDEASVTSAIQSMHVDPPDVVFYGGGTTPGGADLRQQMAAAGLSSVPFIGADAINDGSPASSGSFLQLAGTAGDADTWSTTLTTHDMPAAADVTARYKETFGTDPGAYSMAGYACAKVILDALAHAGPDRAAIRREVTGGTTFDTPLGPVRFDANGDGSQAIVSEYRFDPAAGGGDWEFVRQVNMAAPNG
jgi:branched-chain amino acid transport system substrate-binding protein